MGKKAFRGCSKLSTVNNHENITRIYGGAFRGCTSLESFTVTDEIIFIGKNAFYACKKLKNVTVTNKTKAPKLYSGAFAKTSAALKFTADNKTAAKSRTKALKASGLKNPKVVCA